jgi:glyoxylase-like metal-dependent hydrolase (beta-lactamase superfamily II)
MKHKLSRWLLLGWLGAATAAGFPELRWDPGAEDCAPEQQRIQVQAYDESTIVIRQNPCIDYEANFLYLLIGEERALLLDSGATDDARLTTELKGLVAGYLAKPDGSRLPLVVAHTHGHQDHRAGDAAFAAQPDTVVVPVDSDGMQKFFGLQNWPEGGARFELGNRHVEVIPTPGHHPDHLVFIDSRTRLLFSGDFLLPGRLLVDDIDAYEASALRVIEAVNAAGVQFALGAHIEMSASGELYPGGATFHPDERALPLPFDTERAVALRQALQEFNGFYSRYPDYAVVNPIHNLIALAVGVIAALVLLVWLARRLWKRRRVSGTESAR